MNINPGWNHLQSVSTIAIPSDHCMGYIAFCVLSGNPQAF